MDTELFAALTEINKTLAAQVQAQTDLAHRFEQLVPFVAKKADADDLEKVSDKVDHINNKVNWFSGVGSCIVFIIATIMTYVGIHIAPPR